MTDRWTISPPQLAGSFTARCAVPDCTSWRTWTGGDTLPASVLQGWESDGWRPLGAPAASNKWLCPAEDGPSADVLRYIEAGPFAYLVLYGSGGLAGVYLDEHKAHETAKSREGVVARMPLIADYRVPTPQEDT